MAQCSQSRGCFCFLKCFLCFILLFFPTIKGLNWTNGAIGNADYKGVLVRDFLLASTGLKESDLKGKGLHLVTISYDQDFQGKSYEVSIPLDMALDPMNEIILAYEMNGEDLP